MSAPTIEPAQAAGGDPFCTTSAGTGQANVVQNAAATESGAFCTTSAGARQANVMQNAAGASVDRTFRAMGCDVRIYAATAPGSSVDLERLVAWAEQFIHRADETLTRFDAGSELSRLNADPRETVPVSPLLAVAADVAVAAARRSSGLIDPTLTADLRHAGYDGDWNPARRLPLGELLESAPARRPATGDPDRAWSEIHVDRVAGTVTRRPGITLDLGATAKGLIADLALRFLDGAELAFVDAGGDLAINAPQLTVLAADPFDRRAIELTASGRSGVATSSIAGRCWSSTRGPAHHLLDPSTGRPAFTGVVQATACAPSAAEADWLAGAALLAGPAAGAQLLRGYGGVLTLDDGTPVRVVADAGGTCDSSATAD